MKKTNYLQIGLMMVIGFLIAFFSLGAFMASYSIFSMISDLFDHWSWIGMCIVMTPFFVFGGLFLFLVSAFLLVKKWEKDRSLIRLMVISVLLFVLGLACGFVGIFMSGPI